MDLAIVFFIWKHGFKGVEIKDIPCPINYLGTSETTAVKKE